MTDPAADFPVPISLTREEHEQVTAALRADGLEEPATTLHEAEGAVIVVMVLPHAQLRAVLRAIQRRGESLPPGSERHPLRSSHAKLVTVLEALRGFARAHGQEGASG